MSKSIITDSNLTAIANAIRGKNGSSDTYTPAQMATAIANLPSGGGGDWTDVSSSLVDDAYGQIQDAFACINSRGMLYFYAVIMGMDGSMIDSNGYVQLTVDVPVSYTTVSSVLSYGAICSEEYEFTNMYGIGELLGGSTASINAGSLTISLSYPVEELDPSVNYHGIVMGHVELG